MKSGFTLLELIVVIIIMGVLATLGYSQYTKTVEKERQAEALAIGSVVRKLAIAYYMENGTTSGMTAATFNIGSSSGQIPSACTSTHYYYYSIETAPSDWMLLGVWRCSSGGKPPNAVQAKREWQINCATGTDIFCKDGGCAWGGPATGW